MLIRYAILLAVLITPSFLQAQEIEWHTDLNAAIAKAVKEQKPLMLHCSFKGCGPCRQLETYIFPRDEVVAAFGKNIIAVKVDVLKQKEIAKRYDVKQVPHDVFLSPTGYVILSRSSPRDEAGYVKLVEDVNKNYKSREMLLNGRVNLAEAKDELSEFGGQVRQQSLQMVREEEGSSFSEGVDLVNHATGEVSNLSEALEKSAADKYDTSRRFLPQPDLDSFIPSAMSDVRNEVVADAAKTKNDFVSTGNSFAGQTSSKASQAINNAMESVGNVETNMQQQMHNSFSTVVHNPFIRKPTAANQTADEGTQEFSGSNSKTAATVAEKSVGSSNSSMALDGYCTVTLQMNRAWKKGDERWGCFHRGKLFLFASEELRDKFMLTPDFYAPALAGYDPVVFAETGKLVDGKRDIGVFYPAKDGRIFVFATAESKEKFQKTPELFSDKVRVATSQCDAGSNLR